MRLPAPTRYLLLAMAVLIVVVGLFVFWDHSVDDAYITWRYSQHLAGGLGVTWNPGQPPVEGYTNFLWMVIFAAAARFGLPLLLLSKLIGVACLLATAWLVWRHVRRQTGDEGSAYLALLVLLVFPPTYVHAVSGLETPLYVLLLTALVCTAVEQTEAGVWQVPLLSLLAGLTRPEGVAVGAVALVYLLLRQPAALRRRTLRWTGLLLVLPGAVYMDWRWAQFGWLLPNTFYIKVGHLWGGLNWLFSAVAVVLPLLLVPLFSPHRRRLAPYLILVGVAVLPYAASNAMMNYAQRFVFHVYPLLAIMLGLGVHGFRQTLPKQPPRRWGVLAALLLLIMLQTGAVSAGTELLAGYHLDNAHVALGRALDRAGIDPAWRSLAIGDAGAIPYFSDWRSVDFIGLNDVAIAHGANPTERILQARPTLFIPYSNDGVEPYSAPYRLDTGRLLPGYQPLCAVKWRPRYYLLLYVRTDLPADQLARLRQATAPVALAAERDNAGEGFRAWLPHLRDRLRL